MPHAHIPYAEPDDEKYDVRKDAKYHRLDSDGPLVQKPSHLSQQHHSQPQSLPSLEDPGVRTGQERSGNTEHTQDFNGSSRAPESTHSDRIWDPETSSYLHRLEQEVFEEGEELRERFGKQAHHVQERVVGSRLPTRHYRGSVSCQLVRSASKW